MRLIEEVHPKMRKNFLYYSIVGAVSNVVRRDLAGQKITIHGKTYLLEKKLGSGGFGNFLFIG